MHTITLGKTFWFDHVDRCDDHGCREITADRLTKKEATVTLTDAQLDDLEGDARYYATQGYAMDPDLAKWIVPKAKAALVRIDKYRKEVSV